MLERVRYDGISRCSRAFARDAAALVVLSQLGPGVVRGDGVTLTGLLGPRTHLIVTSQTATRVLGGGRGAHAASAWTVAAGALLDLIGEPLIANCDATYDAMTTIDLAADARVLLTDITRVATTGASVRLRTVVRYAGRELVYDAVDGAAMAPDAFGTLIFAGLPPHACDAVGHALDVFADTHPELTIGVGMMPKAVFLRILAADVWTVREALTAVRARALSAEREAQRELPVPAAAPRRSLSAAPASESN